MLFNFIDTIEQGSSLETINYLQPFLTESDFALTINIFDVF